MAGKNERVFLAKLLFTFLAGLCMSFLEQLLLLTIAFVIMK